MFDDQCRALFGQRLVCFVSGTVGHDTVTHPQHGFVPLALRQCEPQRRPVHTVAAVPATDFVGDLATLGEHPHVRFTNRARAVRVADDNTTGCRFEDGHQVVVVERHRTGLVDDDDATLSVDGAVEHAALRVGEHARHATRVAAHIRCNTLASQVAFHAAGHRQRLVEHHLGEPLVATGKGFLHLVRVELCILHTVIGFLGLAGLGCGAENLRELERRATEPHRQAFDIGGGRHLGVTEPLCTLGERLLDFAQRLRPVGVVLADTTQVVLRRFGAGERSHEIDRTRPVLVLCEPFTRLRFGTVTQLVHVEPGTLAHLVHPELFGTLHRTGFDTFERTERTFLVTGTDAYVHQLMGANDAGVLVHTERHTHAMLVQVRPCFTTGRLTFLDHP